MYPESAATINCIDIEPIAKGHSAKIKQKARALEMIRLSCCYIDDHIVAGQISERMLNSNCLPSSSYVVASQKKSEG
ncbi:hypothetical protein BVH78_09010 [Corynebacterium diphtheriae]|nr:hypothetical protein BVH78_09010 [Corynebacterium diphtheriae]